jgi:hypothetical protein
MGPMSCWEREKGRGVPPGESTADAASLTPGSAGIGSEGLRWLDQRLIRLARRLVIRRDQKSGIRKEGEISEANVDLIAQRTRNR